MNDGTPIRPTRNIELGASGEEIVEFLEEVVEAIPAVLSLGPHQTSLSSFSLWPRSSSTSPMN